MNVILLSLCELSRRFTGANASTILAHHWSSVTLFLPKPICLLKYMFTRTDWMAILLHAYNARASDLLWPTPTSMGIHPLVSSPAQMSDSTHQAPVPNSDEENLSACRFLSMLQYCAAGPCVVPLNASRRLPNIGLNSNIPRIPPWNPVRAKHQHLQMPIPDISSPGIHKLCIAATHRWPHNFTGTMFELPFASLQDNVQYAKCAYLGSMEVIHVQSFLVRDH